MDVSMTVNGSMRTLRVEPRTTLLGALRDECGLTGPKKSCDRGECGACTVHIDGRRMLSCMTLAAMHDGQRVTTIEGLELNWPSLEEPRLMPKRRHLSGNGQLCMDAGFGAGVDQWPRTVNRATFVRHSQPKQHIKCLYGRGQLGGSRSAPSPDDIGINWLPKCNKACARKTSVHRALRRPLYAPF